jgi:hypothetical protein
MTRNLNIIIFITFILSTISNVNSHERIANSACNILIDKVIDNYELIKDHRYVGYANDMYGFTLERTWDSESIDENQDGRKIIGKSKFRRDKDGNIFVLNIYPTYAKHVNLEPGAKILKINDNDVKNYKDNEIDDIFDNKKISPTVTYINNDNKKITETLKTFKENTVTKYFDFKIDNFNSINNQTFETDFLVTYSVQSEMYDGKIKDDYIDMDNDNLFKIVKNTFYNKDVNNDEWYGSCYYTDDELNQMQLMSPGWDVKLLNLSFKSKDTSETSTSFEIFDEITGNENESIDFISTFEGQLKIKNNFDLRNFPFDKQEIVFNFAETLDPDIYIEPFENVYANLDMLMKNENLINGWKLVDYRVKGKNFQEQRFYDDVYLNSFNIILEIERESSYYVYKIILPIFLILMVCWSVMWITPRELESRLTVTIVCLLSLIAYNFVIDGEIPKLEYLTIMDWIIFVSYVFATIPNFLCIISHKLYRTNKKLCFQIEDKAKYFGPITYLSLVLLIISFNVNLEPDNTAQALKVLAK